MFLRYKKNDHLEMETWKWHVFMKDLHLNKENVEAAKKKMKIFKQYL